MAIELQILLYAVALAFVQLAIFAIFANLNLGVRYTTGSRDKPPEGVSTITARLERAFKNHTETLPWFAIAVIVATTGEQLDQVTAAASWTYLVARIAYVPAYVSGIQYVRSAIWGVAMISIGTILLKALF